MVTLICIKFLRGLVVRLVSIILSVIVLLALCGSFPQASMIVRPSAPPPADADFLLNLARSGKIEAQVLLGEHYLSRRQYGEALQWLRSAARMGDPEAQKRLALMYESGQGVARDYEMAAIWFHRACVGGDPLTRFKEDFSYTTSAGIP